MLHYNTITEAWVTCGCFPYAIIMIYTNENKSMKKLMLNHTEHPNGTIRDKHKTPLASYTV